MKKSTLLLAIGQGKPGSADDGEGDMEPDEGSPDEEASDKDEDDAIDTALDSSQDDTTRREAFRKAVELCAKRSSSY